DDAKLPVAPYEGRLETGRAERTAAAADDPDRAPQLHRLGLALELARARVLVDDGRLGGPLGRLADEDAAGLGGGLDPRCGVHEVAGDHPLADGADGDRGLAREDAGPRPEDRRAHLVPEGVDRR